MPLFSVDDGYARRGQLAGDVGAERVEALDQADVAVALQLQAGGQGQVAAAAFAGDDDPRRVDPQRARRWRPPTSARSRSR